MNTTEYGKLVDEYGQGPELLRQAVDAIPTEARGFHPAAGEWNVAELLWHMADSEMLGATRLYMIIAQPGSTLMSYDDDKWSRALRYGERDAGEALTLFRLIRVRNTELLRHQNEAAFAQSAIHPDNPYPEFGDIYNLEKWLRIYTRHVRNHIQQLQDIHAAWKAKGP